CPLPSRSSLFPYTTLFRSEERVFFPDNVFNPQRMRHLMQAQVDRVVGMEKSFHKICPGEHNDTESRIHFSLVIPLRDARVIVIGIDQYLIEVREPYMRESECDLHGNG